MISIITTSVGYFDEHIVPLVESFKAYNKDAEIIVVDQGCHMPDSMDGAKILKVAQTSKARSINEGMEVATGDYFVTIDADVRCRGDYSKIETFDKNKVHGTDLRNMEKRSGVWLLVPWLDEWCIIIPRQVYNRIGGFDPKLLAGMSFGGYDYCIKADKAGIPANQVYLPFEHLWAATKNEIHPRHNMTDAQNKDYVRHKWGIS